MKQHNTPIYNYLRKYAEQNINIFHMPGHKLAKGLKGEFFSKVLQLDVTEIDGTDNLHYPEGIIKEAEELAAKAFGAEKSFFLVNGSTCGVHAAIMSVCYRGQKILVGRDSHKSVVSGLILSGAEPIFLYPEYNEEFGICEGIEPKRIEEALVANPEVKAVLITRPNYYGICSDIREITKIVHRHNKILIVDEAHGAHLAFSEQLPESSLATGADICIQSAHKTLPALTQGAYLHINGDKVNKERIKFNLAMLQTSSPSYLIMSYLDIAREIMATEGSVLIRGLLDNITWLKQKLESYREFKILSNSDLKTKATQDPSRLVINVGRLGISGYFADKLLREKFKTQVEMADNENLVFITTVADDFEAFSALLEALKALRNSDNIPRHEKNTELKNIKTGQYSLAGSICKEFLGAASKDWEYKACAGIDILPSEAYVMQKEQMPLKKAIGRICANIITPYPPGVPILYPGEIIKHGQIEYITSIIESGGVINGISNNKNIQVIK